MASEARIYINAMRRAGYLADDTGQALRIADGGLDALRAHLELEAGGSIDTIVSKYRAALGAPDPDNETTTAPKPATIKAALAAMESPTAAALDRAPAGDPSKPLSAGDLGLMIDGAIAAGLLPSAGRTDAIEQLRHQPARKVRGVLAQLETLKGK